jgi:hypothetical protein
MSAYQNVIQGIYTALAAAVRTAIVTVNGAQLIDPKSANTDPRLQVGINQECSGIIAYLNVTAASGTGGLQLALDEIDPVSGATNNLAITSANTATGLITLKLKPAIAAVAATSTKVAQQDVLPPRWQLRVVHGDASNYTYTLGVVLYN